MSTIPTVTSVPMAYVTANVNGISIFTTMPDYGTIPPPYQKISRDSFVAGLQSKIQNLQGLLGNLPPGYVGETPSAASISQYQQQLSQAQSSQTPPDSGYSLVNGVFVENGQVPATVQSLSNGNVTVQNGQIVYTAQGNPQNPGSAVTQPQTNTSTPTTTSTTPASNNQPNKMALPTTNLQPGQSGQDVTNLQNWLIQNGYNIPSGATGYYGAETKAAVTALQQKLGVNAGNNAGYFGPLTISAINSNPTIASGPTNSGNNGNTGTAGIEYNPAWASYGVTQSIWSQLNAAQQANVAIGMNVNLDNYAANASSLTLQDALAEASKDPNIIAKYADMLKLDTQQLTQSLQQIQSSISDSSTKNQLQFEADRKALAEAQAAAGTAYSGFRGDATNRLATDENSVVTSSKAALQKNLDDMTSAFESKYGSAATTPATANFINPMNAAQVDIYGLKTNSAATNETFTGGLAGGITGTNTIQKQQDINDLAGQKVIANKPVPITPITV